MLQVNPHLRGTGMPDDIGQGFLQQAIQVGLVRAGQRRQRRVDPQLTGDALALLPLSHQQFESLGQRLEPLALQGLDHLLELERAAVPQARLAGRIEQQLRSEEHTSELQSLMRISYAVFCLTKKNHYFITHKKY